MATSKEAWKIYDHVKARLGPEVMLRFNLSIEGFEKQIQSCVGPAIDREAATEIIIKLFDVQWENLKE